MSDEQEIAEQEPRAELRPACRCLAFTPPDPGLLELAQIAYRSGCTECPVAPMA